MEFRLRALAEIFGLSDINAVIVLDNLLDAPHARLVVHEMVGDGNCLFYSFAATVGDGCSLEVVNRLRAMVAETYNMETLQTLLESQVADYYLGDLLRRSRIRRGDRREPLGS